MLKQEYTITVYTENQIGLLNRIAIIFSRRKINIESLNTSPSEVDSVHRFTIVINETEDRVNEPLDMELLLQIFADLREGFTAQDLEELEWAMNVEYIEPLDVDE